MQQQPSGDIRIVALDLDGTLLDSEKRLSPRNRAALERVAARGVHVVPTTGRFFGMMPEVVRDLPFVRYAITINGAQVYDRAEDRALVREEMPVDEAVRIMEMLDGFDVIYDCYRNNWGWMTAALKAKAAEYVPDEHYLRIVREFRRPVPELKAHLRETEAEGGVQKVMLFSRNDDPSAAALAAIRREAAVRFPSIRVTASTWNDLELNSDAANKGNALRRFAESLGLTLENCMAFGDGLNDLSMIEAAGVGVAMANAVPEVKAAAGRVTLSNDDDGVAAVLEELL
ncbi:MAG: HAD family phosphatase [Kiritimatiellae bacterium]|nr:HAD family phosphatase [Kiritimatiellia bacterium]